MGLHGALLNAELGADLFVGAAGDEERVRGHLAKTDSFLAVADDGGEVVGMALGMQGLDDDGAGPPVAGLWHISMVFVHPQVGELRVDREKLAITGTEGMMLVVYHAEPGSESAEKLALLALATLEPVEQPSRPLRSVE